MIISDQYKIAFIHIPKCGGTTVRQYLEPFDSSNGKFSRRVDYHQALGLVDHVHIPLFILKEHFQEEFELIKSYRSYAVVRNPYDRFFSSVAQRVKMYSGRNFATMNKNEINYEIKGCIKKLRDFSENNKILPPEFIHFQRQVDYIFLDGEKIVSNVFCLECMDELINNIVLEVGEDDNAIKKSVVSEAMNQTVVFRGFGFKFFYGVAKPYKNIVFSLFSEAFLSKVKNIFFKVPDKKYFSGFYDEDIEEFISDYYKCDIELYESLMRLR